VSGERLPSHGDRGERLADWRSQTPEDASPPNTRIDPADPLLPWLGKIAVTEPVREAPRTPPPEREAPPEERTRDPEPPSPERAR
jgi:hypothetical protein